MDWTTFGGIVVAAVGAVSVGLVFGAGLATVYGWIERLNEPAKTDPPVADQAAASASARVLPGPSPESRRFQIVVPDLTVIHRRRQQRYRRMTKH